LNSTGRVPGHPERMLAKAANGPRNGHLIDSRQAENTAALREVTSQHLACDSQVTTICCLRPCGVVEGQSQTIPPSRGQLS
jgi:hypothetical protein